MLRKRTEITVFGPEIAPYLDTFHVMKDICG